MKNLCTSILFAGMLCLAAKPIMAQTWAWGANSSSPTLTTQNAQSHANDRWGNIFVAGSSERGMFDVDNISHIGPFTISSPDRFTSFLVKYNSAGTPIWAKQMTKPDYMHIATDYDGNVFITGAFIKSVTIGTHVVYGVDTANPSNINVLVAKLDPSGNVLWMRAAGSPGGASNFPYSIATDNAGNVVVAGVFTTRITFGATTLDTIASIYGGQYDAFVAKYDGSGNVLWANSIQGNSDELPYSLTTDPTGNVIVAGSSLSSSIVAGSTVSVNTSPDYRMFVLKYSSAGALSWLQTATGNYSLQGSVMVRARGVSADENGNIYVTGSTNAGTTNFGGYMLSNPGSWGQFMFAKYNAAGNCLWAKVTGFGTTCSSALGTGIAAVGSDFVYVTGCTASHDPFAFGGGTIDPFSNYLMKSDTAGNITTIECRPMGEAAWNTMTADAAGNAYISGKVGVDATFGTSLLTHTGNTNAFLAKYGSTPIVTSVAGLSATNVRIFPNPANDQLYIEAGESTGHVVIGNMLGQVQLTTDFRDGKATIGIADLAPGVYYVRVNGEATTFVKQ